MTFSFSPLLAQEAVVETVSLLDGLHRDQRFVLILVSICLVAGILITAVSVAAHTIGTIQKRKSEAELKQDMLDRGMSADEIATVVESTPPTDFLERWAKK